MIPAAAMTDRMSRSSLLMSANRETHLLFLILIGPIAKEGLDQDDPRTCKHLRGTLQAPEYGSTVVPDKLVARISDLVLSLIRHMLRLTLTTSLLREHASGRSRVWGCQVPRN